MVNAVDCGGGNSCPAGDVCRRGGGCATREQLAAEHAAEQQRKREAAAREEEEHQRQIAQQKAEAEAKQQAIIKQKEEAAALAAEKARQENERLAAEVKAAAEKKAAAQKLLDQERELARLQKETQVLAAKVKAEQATKMKNTQAPVGSRQQKLPNPDIKFFEAILGDPTQSLASRKLAAAVLGKEIPKESASLDHSGSPSVGSQPTQAARELATQPPPQSTTASNPDVQKLLTDPKLAVSGSYGRTLNGSIVDLRTGQVVATGGVTTANPTQAVPLATPAALPQAAGTATQPSANSAITSNSDIQKLLTDPKLAVAGNYARTVNGSIVDLRSGAVVATGGVTTAGPAQTTSVSAPATPPPAAATQPPPQSTTASNPDVQKLLTDPKLAVSGSYGRTLNGSIVDLRTGQVVATGGVTTSPAQTPPITPTDSTSGVAGVASQTAASSHSYGKSGIDANAAAAPPLTTTTLLTAFYSQDSSVKSLGATSSFASNAAAPALGQSQTSDLWATVNAAVKANNSALNSPIGQTIVDTLAAAGGAFAPDAVTRVTDFTNSASDLAEAAGYIRSHDYLSLAHQASEKIAENAAETAGVMLFPENPALGKAVGSASASALIDIGNFYVAPALGDLMFGAYPQLFTPPPTVP